MSVCLSAGVTLKQAVLLTIYKKNCKIIDAPDIKKYKRNFYKMSLSKETATEKAKKDLAERLGLDADSVKTVSVEEKEFSDMSLGAAVGDELAAQMISYGYEINLEADGKNYEYRGDKYQLRLVDFEGENLMIESY